MVRMGKLKVLGIVLWQIQAFAISAYSQDIPPVKEQQLENQVDESQVESEDDTYLLALEQFVKYPLNLNEADEEDLKDLRLLTDLQIDNFIGYRRLLGPLLSIYELQAVPAWDPGTIRKLIPYIIVGPAKSIRDDLKSRFKGGLHQILLRISQTIEPAAGFVMDSTGTKYLGSAQKVYVRYRYVHKNNLQFGLLADKDAGEQMLMRGGPDFISAFLFIGKAGTVQSLVVGDFTINMGQGLMQWQSLAFKKSAEVLSVKRQAQTLRSYNAAGEFYFHRGVGITVKKGKFEATGFISFRKLSANIDSDSTGRFVSSIITSGLHRSTNELADKSRLKQTSFGGNVRWKINQFQCGINGVYYGYSLPIKKRDEPYNLYAIRGKRWHNLSIDYSYTWKNFHLFGEIAIDKNLNIGQLGGLIISVDPKVDISIVQRALPSDYQAVYGNAFTENTQPSNETGLYWGINIRPSIRWRVDAYIDFYRFPWLKYQIDFPTYGKDLLTQISYSPGKLAEVYSRFRLQKGYSPGSLNPIKKVSWRTHLDVKGSQFMTIRSRVDLLWLVENNGFPLENGYLFFIDFLYKNPSLIGASFRWQFFETGGYNSRLYAYEHDVLYGYSIPALAGKGIRYYLNINYDLNKRTSCWLRFAQTIYREQTNVGSGADEVKGNRKSDVKLQIRLFI